METVVHTMARWGLKGGVALTGWHDKQPCSVWQVPAERDLSYSTYDRWAMENILCQAWCGPPTPKKVMQEHPERFSEKKPCQSSELLPTALPGTARSSLVLQILSNKKQGDIPYIRQKLYCLHLMSHQHSPVLTISDISGFRLASSESIQDWQMRLWACLATKDKQQNNH